MFCPFRELRFACIRIEGSNKTRNILNLTLPMDFLKSSARKMFCNFWEIVSYISLEKNGSFLYWFAVSVFFPHVKSYPMKKRQSLTCEKFRNYLTNFFFLITNEFWKKKSKGPEKKNLDLSLKYWSMIAKVIIGYIIVPKK